MPCTISFAASVQPDGSAILAGTVAWGPSPGPNLGGYELQWSTDGGTLWPGSATLGADALAYVIAPTLAETSYQARVRAVSMNGQAKSTWEVSAAVNSGALVPAVPAAPTGLAAAAIAGAVALGWNANAAGDAVLSYQLVREAGTVTGDPTSAATIFSGDALTATDSTTGASATFTYWLRATNAKGAGAWGSPATQTSGIAAGGTSPADTIKGNDTGAAAATLDLTPAQVTAMLPAVAGDSGSGGTQGLVPAPAAGDAAGGKFLKADGTWAVPPGAGGGGGGFNPYAAGVPVLSQWTQVNATGASFAQGAVSGTITTALSITAPETTSDSAVLLTMAAPVATPYRVAVCGKLSATIAPTIEMFAGWVDSAGKMQVIGIADRTSGAYEFGLSVHHQDAPVPTTNVTDVSPVIGLPADTVWFGLRNDGTTIYFEWSQDSVNWVTIYAIAIAGGYLADVGKICIGINPVNPGSTAAVPDTATFVTVDPNGLGRTLASVYGGGGGGAVVSGNNFYGQDLGTPPTSASTALTNWLNQGSNAAVTDVTSGIFLVQNASEGSSENQRCRVKDTPSTPYKITALLLPSLYVAPGSYCACGLVLRDSGSGKMQVFAIEGTPTTSNYGYGTFVSNYSSFTSSAGVVSGIYAISGGPYALQIVNDGTTLSYYASPDLASWRLIYSTTIASAYLPDGGDQIGIYVNGYSSAIGVTLLYWSETDAPL